MPSPNGASGKPWRHVGHAHMACYGRPVHALRTRAQALDRHRCHVAGEPYLGLRTSKVVMMLSVVAAAGSGSAAWDPGRVHKVVINQRMGCSTASTKLSPKGPRTAPLAACNAANWVTPPATRPIWRRNRVRAATVCRSAACSGNPIAEATASQLIAETRPK